MASNLDKYRSDLERLVEDSNKLLTALQFEWFPERFEEHFKKSEGGALQKYVESLPKFSKQYQGWYSEAKAVIKQLLPDRLEDFVRHYQKPKVRKAIDFENYRIEDCLQGLTVTRNSYAAKETIVDGAAAIPHVEQQVAILQAAALRFESSLFDIKQLVQADVFDSELESAQELNRKGFSRAAGAIAGVILERHLAQVCSNHNLHSTRKTHSISEYNDLLKASSAIDVPTWRHIQRLGDLRNLCDHPKDREPTKDEIDELISGTDRFLRTLF